METLTDFDYFFYCFEVYLYRGEIMDRHSKNYEQFCWVKQRNIIMEETVFHNGKRKIICTCLDECIKNGGCKNAGLCRLWERCITDEDKLTDGIL